MVTVKHWMNLSFAETDIANSKGRTVQMNAWGNPLWDTAARQLVWRQILGYDANSNDGPKDGKSFLDEWAQAFIDSGFADPGKSAEDYFDPVPHAGKFNPYTDVNYTGRLPALMDYGTNNVPWHQVTTDPNSYNYKNPCLNKPAMDAILPYAAGAVGGILGAIIVPGSTARAMAGATAGGTSYFMASGFIGWTALTAWAEGDMRNKDDAATILSVGTPMTAVQILWDFDLVPATYNTTSFHIGSLVVAAALGYAVILPVVKPVMEITGDTVQILTAPISLVEGMISYITSGCLAHNWPSKESCKCEDANVKPALVDALVGPIYGCTDEQKIMRTMAAHAVITDPDGSWGTSPYYMGQCDGNGRVDNPFACISAGEWAYQQFLPDIEVEAKERWDEFSDVFDPANPSFLPPRQGVDEPCAQYGKFFRLDTDGKCKDKRAPKGKQGPGEYDWSALTEINKANECTIL